MEERVLENTRNLENTAKQINEITNLIGIKSKHLSLKNNKNETIKTSNKNKNIIFINNDNNNENKNNENKNNENKNNENDKILNKKKDIINSIETKINSKIVKNNYIDEKKLKEWILKEREGEEELKRLEKEK